MSGEGQQTSGEELLGMSDEEILKMSGPPAVTQEASGDETGQADTNASAETTTVETTEVGADTSAATTEDTAAGGTGTGEAVVEPTAGTAETSTEAKEPAGTKAEEKDTKDTKEPGEKEPTATSPGSTEGGIAEPTADQAVSFYKQIMAPFKANGKMIQLKDPAEAISLMQMGANYTRKLQDIQPHRKMLLMLQNNDLLDEGRLSYLIDLDKKNPEAIKKLIKDSGIDPMDIDTSSEPAYSEGNHIVSDEEAGFRQALDEMTSSQAGKETVQVINTNWDQASKEALWQSPQIMSVIHEQRESGVYDVITAEMDRQITLGKIPPSTPFLQAYKIVGDALAQTGQLGGNPEPEVKQPVATTVATPKPAVTNGDKASAASPTRTTTRKAEKLVNPLAMSDEEFLKLDQFNGRL